MKCVLIVVCVLALAGPGYANIVNVTLETNYGDIGLALDDVAAPITVANFLNYVTDGFYDGLIFHRISDDPAIIQGGVFDQDLNRITPTYSPIVNESGNGLSNLSGTIAMVSGPPNSATSQFYINHADNTGLDQSKAVFGVVAFGMDVVDAIAAVATSTQQFPHGVLMSDVPVEDVIIESAYVVTAPEPATIIMLGLGGFSLIKSKKK